MAEINKHEYMVMFTTAVGARNHVFRGLEGCQFAEDVALCARAGSGPAAGPLVLVSRVRGLVGLPVWLTL